jgi:hypothetical protein
MSMQVEALPSQSISGTQEIEVLLDEKGAV